jgi:hypothetical protein
MTTRSRIQSVSTLLNCLLAFNCGFGLTPSLAQGERAPAASSALEDAARVAQPGTPEYIAALRSGLVKATNDLRANQAAKTRSIGPIGKREVLPDPNDFTRSLSIDTDPRYVLWLKQTAGLPSLEVDIGLDQERPVRVRSIGGERVKDMQIFSEVAVATENGQGFCSGVLIEPRTILTAAHCLCGHQNISLVVFGTNLFAPTSKMGVLGQRGREGVVCPDETVSNSKHRESLSGRDVAVLRLQSASALPTISPITKDRIGGAETLRRQLLAGNNSLIVVGFGWTRQTGGDDLKNLIRVPILSPDCSEKLSPTETDASRYGCREGAEILSVDPRQVGPCHGDSGGGAFVMKETNVDGKLRRVPVLVGIVSRSIDHPKHDCGDGAIFTLLTDETIEWVRKAAADLALAHP